MPAEDRSASIDGRWLRALAIDLYGRPPSDEERTLWLGKPAASFVSAALADEGAWRHWFHEQLYYFLLIDRFRPVGTQLDEIPKLLAERRMSARDALHRIALCTSFDLRNPGADTFVTVVMEQLCGLTVQDSKRELEIGKSAYDGGSGLFLGERAASQSDVVKVAATHERAARHLVAREFGRVTRAEPGRSLVRKAARSIHRAPMTFHALLAGWYSTPEYARRVADGAPLTNRTWIQCVFHDLGGEPPGAEDAESLRSALDGLGDPAPLRSAIVRMLLAGERRPLRGPEIADPGAWVDGTFERILGRAPTPPEQETFVDVVKGSSNGPELALYAILSSPEYSGS